MAKWLKENSTLPDKELWVSQLKTMKLMLIGLLAMNTNLWMVLLSHGRPPESCTGSYETGSWFEPHGGRTALWCTPPVSFLTETCQKDQTGWRSARNFLWLTCQYVSLTLKCYWGKMCDCGMKNAFTVMLSSQRCIKMSMFDIFRYELLHSSFIACNI